MKPIEKNELYQHVSEFLKGKGIELKAGSYASGIQTGCSILADAINLSQRGITRAKVGLDGQLDRMRQAIHEKTAPAGAARAAGKASARPAPPRSKKKAATAPKAKAKAVKKKAAKPATA
jgi:hypothetical protein